MKTAVFHNPTIQICAAQLPLQRLYLPRCCYSDLSPCLTCGSTCDLTCDLTFALTRDLSCASTGGLACVLKSSVHVIGRCDLARDLERDLTCGLT